VVDLHVEVLAAVPKNGPGRRRIVDFIYSLAEEPLTVGDLTDHDVSGRTRQIKIIGDYAITYWVDHPVKSVRVVDGRLADGWGRR
jgi:hypothetical protein